MTEFSKALRDKLAACAVVMEQQIDKQFYSQDGTRRYLFKLKDGREIESVWIPETERATICISSQVGCPLACEFCLTAQLKLKRNLLPGEIVGQIITVLSDVYGPKCPPDRQINIVLMGMGEPLLNYDNVLAAIRLMNDAEGLAVSTRHITLSTAGIVPKIYDLGKEEIRPKLAISLTGATDELRDRLMPINRKYPLKELLQACRDFPLKPRERITFEYVMLAGVTDSNADAKRLVKLLSGLKAKVNLIPHNPAEELPFESSSVERIAEFQQILIDHGLSAFIRRPRGQDIFAACGQLAAKNELVEV
jgi:23S rRNA (adenine2503-C2)-methyltransferase